MQTQQEIIIKMALDGWNSQIKRTNQLFDSITDEQLANEVASNRNTGVYLLGHLAAVHDGMLALLGLGDRIHPELEVTFIRTPDKSGLEFPSIPFLRQYWNDVNNSLSAHFSLMTADDWFGKHTAVSAEDFEKEPHRNKLNVLLSRTTHLANHLGQLAFLAVKG